MDINKTKTCILFPTADLTEIIQIYYESYPLLLPICTIAKALKAMRMYC